MYSEIKFAYLGNGLWCWGRRGVIWDPSLSGSFHWDSRAWASRSCRLVAVNACMLVGGSYFLPWTCSQKIARTTESRAGKLTMRKPTCLYAGSTHLPQCPWGSQVTTLDVSPYLIFHYATTHGNITGPWNVRNSSGSTFHLAGEPLSSQICAGVSSLYMGLGILSQLSHHACMVAVCPTEQSC